MKTFFLKYNTKKAVKELVKRETPNYSQAKKIGVLFQINHEENHEEVNKFVALLKKDGKSVETLTFFERQHNNPYDFAFNFFTKRDISLLGSFRSYEVNRFIDIPFDYLYCITINEQPAFDLILSRSKAKCRIGKYSQEKENLYEMMIDINQEAKEDTLIKEMVKYTKAISKN